MSEVPTQPDPDKIKHTLKKALQKFMFRAFTDETIQQAKEALALAAYKLAGETPYIDVDTSDIWKGEVSFDVTWDDGEQYEVKIGPDSISIV